MNARRKTLTTMGVAAAAAGAGLAGYHFASRDPAPPPSPAASADTASSPEQTFWSLQFERPHGGDALRMTALRGHLTLLNFWATWCPPCVKELPMLDAFHREHSARGWQVIGIAIDGPTPVREFLARAPVGFAVGLGGLDGIDLIKSLGNASGALPYTVIFDRSGAQVDRKLGELSTDDLQAWSRRFTA